MFFAFGNVKDKLSEFLPDENIRTLKLTKLKEAVEFVHFPNNLEDAQKGRERLAFNELFFFQLQSLYRKKNWSKNKVSHLINPGARILSDFLAGLPFKLTDSQKRSITEIFKDPGVGIEMANPAPASPQP